MIQNIQTLRALAAGVVVICHALWILRGGGWDIPASMTFGQSGVDLFFVISGFVMVHTTRAGADAADFMRRRILRIAPLYTLITLYVAAVVAFAPSAYRAFPMPEVSLETIAKSLLYLPYAGGPIVGPGWSLNFEMFFYIVFAALIAAFGARQAPLATGVALTAYVTLALALAAPYPFQLFANTMILEFVFGMAIGWVWPHLPALQGKARQGMLALLALGLVGFLAPHALGYEDMMWRFLVVGLPSALVVLAAVWLERSGFAWAPKPALALGDASYAVYLVHMVLINHLMASPLAAYMGPNRALVLFVAVLVGAHGIGWLVHRWIEKPIGKALSAVFARKPLVTQSV
jgi:exopolysaccharide production protein ExoZ